MPFGIFGSFMRDQTHGAGVDAGKRGKAKRRAAGKRAKSARRKNR